MAKIKATYLLFTPLVFACNSPLLAEEQELELPSLSVEETQQAPKETENEDAGSEKQGYRVKTSYTGILGKRSLKDTPYSINVTSSSLMENLQASSVADALKYNPTVNSGSGANSVGGGAAFQIRGFVTDTNESFVDGMRMYSRTPIEDKERVEVLNGSSSFLYGFANPAGIVNYTLKRPTAKPLAKITTGLYSGKQLYAHGDFGGPIDEANRFGYRLNIVKVGAGETAVPNQHHESYLLSYALDWNINPDTRWSFDYSHYQNNIDHGDNQFSLGKNVTHMPNAPDAGKNYMPAYSQARDGYRRLGTLFHSDLNEMFSVRAGMAYSHIYQYRHRAKDTFINNSGDYTVSRVYYDDEKFTRNANIALDMKLNTWGIGHTVTLGYQTEYDNTKYAAPYKATNVSISGVYNINSSADYAADVSGDPTGNANASTDRLRLTTTTLADQIQLNEHWSAMIGASRLSLHDHTKAYTTAGAVSSRNNTYASRISPTYALMYKPVPNVTLYASYIEALQKGDTAPTTADNANQTLSPYTSRQVEVGAKTSLGEMDLNVALFRVRRAYSYTDTTDNIFKMSGKDTHMGIEFTASGKVTPNLSLMGGFTLMHTRVTGTSNPSLDHKRPQGVPQEVARLYAEYSVNRLPGLALTGGMSYTGKIYYDAANQFSIPDVFTTDIGARYRTGIVGKDLTFRLNVSNLFNHDYWTSTGGSLTLGAPRSVALSASLNLF